MSEPYRYHHGGDVYAHPDVLDFSSNRNPLGTPPSVVRAAVSAMKEIRNYPDPMQTVLRSRVSAYENVQTDHLIFGNGAAELIYMLAAVLRPGLVLLPVPTFTEYEAAMRLCGAQFRYYHLESGNDFHLGEDFADLICEDTDLVILCNPNNPTGKITDSYLLDRIIRKAEACGARVLLDECFLDFAENRELYDCVPVIRKYKNLFILKAFTKKYAMAGLRLGYGISADIGLLQKMRRSTQPWNVSVPAQAAGAAAVLEEDYMERARILIKRERGFLIEGLRSLGFRVWDSDTDFILFRGKPGLKEKALLRNVLIRDCSDFRGLGPGYYRVAVRLHEENRKLLAALS